jgi:diguanylate cyclase (GGDEF)-like protein
VALLSKELRNHDVLARFGGDEFAVLLPSTQLASAVKVAERQRTRIAEAEVVVDDHIIQVTASFGVASYPADGIRDINELMKAADEALYEAKQSGRNRVVAATGK